MFQKVKSDFKSLGDALKSGDLSAAKKAFAALQKDLPKSSSSEASGTASNSDDPFAALSKALKSGDIKSAQDAFNALQSQKSQRHTPGSNDSASLLSTTLLTDDNTDSDSSSGTILNALA